MNKPQDLHERLLSAFLLLGRIIYSTYFDRFSRRGLREGDKGLHPPDLFLCLSSIFSDHEDNVMSEHKMTRSGRVVDIQKSSCLHA